MSPSAKVCHISTTTIYAANPSPTNSIELTPWDLSSLVLHPIQKGLLFHHPSHHHHPNWLTNLKTSLSLTLTHFFPLAGRLATRTHGEDNTVSIFIECNNAGAEFLHVTADITVSDILNPIYVPRIVNDFFPLNLTLNYAGRSGPLLAVQITELTDGVFIGVTANHVIVDGTSFWHLINSWSEICKSGSDKIPLSPNFTRSFLPDLPIRISTSTIDKSLRPYPSPPLQERVFHFAPQNVAKLKQKANLENNPNNNNAISSLQAVLAHVWGGVVRARNLEADHKVSYVVAMGNRGRLEPPLPEGYFGNSYKSRMTTTTAGELVYRRGLGFGAELLNKTVGAHTSANIWSDWEKWVREPKFTCFDDLEIDAMISGSSPRFNTYGNDFGWGRPIAVRSGSANKFNGKLTVFPGAVEGSIEIEASLSMEILKGMDEDSEFMEVVGTLSDRNAF